MADDAMRDAWEKAANDITKGKNEGALQALRAADPQAVEPMTARLVGEATWNIAKTNDSKSDYRKAAMFLREASKKKRENQIRTIQEAARPPNGADRLLQLLGLLPADFQNGF